MQRPPTEYSLATTGGLVRWGVLLFGAGVVAIVVTFIGYVAGDTNRPLWQNLLCVLAPVGLGVALVGLVRDARAQSAPLVERFPATPVPLEHDDERRRLHARIATTMRLVAVAETMSWLLLIAATVAKFAGGWQLGVQILGPTHGTLFIGYCVVAVVAWRALGWSLVTLVVVLVESFIPGGGFLVAHRADLRRGTISGRASTGDLARLTPPPARSGFTGGHDGAG